MKIRTGFVSNSSSSSFVVALPHKPKDVKDLQEMLFGKEQWHYNSIAYDGDDKDVPTIDIAEKVFKKIKRKATKKEIFESIADGWFDVFFMLPGHYNIDQNDPDYERIDNDDPNRMEKLRKQWAKESKENKKRAKDISEAFQRMNKEKYIVVMSFSDNDGEAMEEHTDIFRRVEKIRTSYH